MNNTNNRSTAGKTDSPQDKKHPHKQHMLQETKLIVVFVTICSGHRVVSH